MQNKIKIRPSQVGSLHRLLGISQGSKIPANQLTNKPGDSTAVKKKKNFARNARHFDHMPGMSKLMGK